MPRIHKPKKDLLIVSVKGPAIIPCPKCGNRISEKVAFCPLCGQWIVEPERRAYRCYVFALAEKLYPERFADLKRRALPLYRASERHPVILAGTNVAAIRARLKSQPSPWPGEARDPYLRTRSSDAAVERLKAKNEANIEPAVALEKVINEWCGELGLVASEKAERTLWLRELAHDRVRAWHEGDEAISDLIIGGVNALAAPRIEARFKALRVPDDLLTSVKDETPEKAAKRVIRAKVNAGNTRKVPEWNRVLRFHQHFEWFVQRRVGELPLKSLARPGQGAQTVAEAIRAIAAVVDLD